MGILWLCLLEQNRNDRYRKPKAQPRVENLCH